MSGFDWRMMVGEISPMAMLLATGITMFLGAGCGLLLVTRSPAHRQRTAESALLAAIIWSFLAVLPLPRCLSIREWNRPPASSAESHTAALQTRSTGSLATPKVPATIPAALRRDHAENPQALENAEIASRLDSEVEHDLVAVDVHLPAVPHEDLETTPVTRRSVSNSADHNEETHESRQAVLSVAEPVSNERLIPAVSLLSGFYFAGAAICLSWLVIGQWLLFQLQRRSLSPEPWLADLFHSLSTELQVEEPALIVLNDVDRALSWGVLRPVIALPRSMCHRENQSQLRMVLLHELGHIVRKDARGNLLICLVMPLLYVHPMFWWLRSQIRMSSELLADDWAAVQAGREDYVESLIALAKSTAGKPVWLAGATGVMSSPSQFYRRMNMLLVREKPLPTQLSPRWRWASLGLWTVLLGLSAASLGVHPVTGQDSPKTDPDVPKAESGGATEKAPDQAEQGKAEAKPESKEEAPKAEAPAAENSEKPDQSGVVPTPVKKPGELPKSSLLKGLEGTAQPSAVQPAMEVKLKHLEILKLKQELAKLQSQLKALEGEGANSLEKGAFEGKSIVITRRDENGRLIQERWTLDENGKPGKLISRAESVAGATTSLQNANGGRIKVLVTKDGKAILEELELDGDGKAPTVVVQSADGVLKSYDGAKIVPVPAAVPKGAGVPNHAPEVVGAPAGQVKPGPAASSGSSSRMDAGLDLVSLATSYADALAAVETARIHVQHNEKLKADRVVSQQEVDLARVVMQSAERKEKLLRKIATSAAENAKHRLEAAQAAFQSARGPYINVVDAKDRLEILSQILESPSESEKPGSAKPEPATEKLQQM